MWRGFHGPSELINGSYKELIEQHAELGKINAALSMIAADSDKHVFFLLVGPSHTPLNFTFQLESHTITHSRQLLKYEACEVGICQPVSNNYFAGFNS